MQGLQCQQPHSPVQVTSEAHYRKLALSFSNVTGDSRGKELFSLPVRLAACRKTSRKGLSAESRIYLQDRSCLRAMLVQLVQGHKHHKKHAERHFNSFNSWCCNSKLQNAFMAAPFQGILKELKGHHQGPVTLLTKNIPHSSGRDFCTALAAMCLRTWYTANSFSTPMQSCMEQTENKDQSGLNHTTMSTWNTVEKV